MSDEQDRDELAEQVRTLNHSMDVMLEAHAQAMARLYARVSVQHFILQLLVVDAFRGGGRDFDRWVEFVMSRPFVRVVPCDDGELEARQREERAYLEQFLESARVARAARVSAGGSPPC